MMVDDGSWWLMMFDYGWLWLIMVDDDDEDDDDDDEDDEDGVDVDHHFFLLSKVVAGADASKSRNPFAT